MKSDNKFPKVLVYLSITKQNDDELFFCGYFNKKPNIEMHFSLVADKRQATVFDNKFVAAKTIQDYIAKINWLWCESINVKYIELES